MQKQQQWVAVPRLHSRVVGESPDAEPGKKAAENAGGQKRRRGGEKERVIHSCPKDLVPYTVGYVRFGFADIQRARYPFFPDFNDFLFSFDLMCWSFLQKRTMFQQKSGKTGNAPPKYLQIHNKPNCEWPGKLWTNQLMKSKFD